MIWGFERHPARK